MKPLLWSEPRGPMRAAAVLQHGFARTPERLSGLAQLLADQGVLVVRASIPSWTLRHSLHDESFLQAVGETVVSRLRERAPDAAVLGIGHSAGAAVVAGWMPQGLEGVILLDPVDRHRRIAGLVGTCAPESIRVITADPSSCNRHGAATRTLVGAGLISNGRNWQSIPHTSHPDPERVPATLDPADVGPTDLVARWACGRGGNADAVCAWGATTLRYLDDLLTGNP